MENYTKLDKLGEGTYGIVYKAQDNRTGEIVALKMMKVPGDDGIPATTL
jgi:serine/threonine protein kinase